ncbi:MAG: hypothetical protein DI533_08145 [Cereibacter sphaeroides]|uniref:17 kDa surface antigen n=1 Tax=Cereibacter sphaeroides TaxID=1063 RepID=A0A2W5SME6_CERSP|nr:MAG: hypothetical protein DI533_08145 [Cereibacter sphaeroides]
MRAFLLTIPLAILPLAACVDNSTSGMYPSSSTVSQNQVLNGTIVSWRQVQQGGSNTDRAVGAVAGGLAGGLLGNQFGGGSGKDLATVAGAVGGAALGSNLAGNSGRVVPAWTIRLDDGRTVEIVQNQSFAIGQRVQVRVSGNQMSIIG